MPQGGGQDPANRVAFWDARASRYDTLKWVHDPGLLAWSGQAVFRAMQLVANDAWPTCRVLEVGCGSGAFTAHLTQFVKSLTAVDISPAMLTKTYERVAARAVMAQADAFANQGPAIHGAPFDVVVARMVVRHQAHLGMHVALGRLLYRHVRPGGALVVVEGAPPSSHPQVLEFYRRVMETKHGAPRAMCRGVDLADGMMGLGCHCVETHERWTYKNSLRNWLDAADVPPAMRAEIVHAHALPGDVVAQAYHMAHTEDGDVLMRWRHVAAIGVRPE